MIYKLYSYFDFFLYFFHNSKLITMSNFLNGETIIYKSTTDLSKNREFFLKEFLRYFYRKIINTNDFYLFECNVSELIKNIRKNSEIILELMKNHNKSDLWFS